MAFLAAAPVAEEAGAAVAGRVAAKKAAKKAAGRKAAARRAPAGSRNLNDLDPAERPAELQARADKARRKGNADVVDQLAAEGKSLPTPPEAEPSASPSPGGGRPLFGPVKVGGAGGGLVLGAMAYVLGLTYLRSGSDGVKALLKAKFLNDTSAAPAAAGLGPYTRPSGTAAGDARSPVAASGGPGKRAR